MIETKKTNPNKPVRIMIYGVEGTGKSTFGAKSEKPIFISAEGGNDQLTDAEGHQLNEMLNVDTWDGMRAAVQSLIKEQHDYKTLVVDSADWIESLAHVKIIGASGKDIIRCNGGYGSGYRESQNLHKSLIDDLSILREKKGMNIVVTAHAHVKDVKDPSANADYQSFEIKCHEFVSALWREWVDGLFFVRFATFLKSDDSSKARAFGDGSRVIYTVKQPAFQAKNRYEMPAEIKFTKEFWQELMKYARKEPYIVADQSSTEHKKELSALELIKKINFLIPTIDEKTKKAAIESLAKAEQNTNKLLPILKRLEEITGLKK